MKPLSSSLSQMLGSTISSGVNCEAFGLPPERAVVCVIQETIHASSGEDTPCKQRHSKSCAANIAAFNKVSTLRQQAVNRAR